MNQESLYNEAAGTYGAALDRLARAYELDAEARRDLLQDIHFHLWRSFASFDQRCSLRTWVYRVAHNVAASHVIRQRRLRSGLISLEAIEFLPTSDRVEQDVARAQDLERLAQFIRRLRPLDRQIIICYLEGMDAASIGEITGLSAGNIATKIHRIKDILKRSFGEGGSHAE